VVTASSSFTSRGVRTGTWASRTSSSGIDGDLYGVAIGLRRTNGGADGDRAHGKRCDDCD
jgi:hypothetical protein